MDCEGEKGLSVDACESEKGLNAFDKWHIYGCEELLLPPKPPDYLVDGLIRHPSVICFYGPPGGLKTMLMLDLYVSIASGQPWLIPSPLLLEGGKPYPVKHGPVFIVDQENGINRLQERIGALCRGREVDTIPIYGLSLPNPPFKANILEYTERLADRLKEVGAVFCIVDSLSAVSGGVEENSSLMAGIMRNLRLCSDISGATIAIIHHPRKGNASETGGREGDRLRGHGSIEASLDLAVYVDRKKDNTLILKTTKTRDDPWPELEIEWGYKLGENKALQSGWFFNNGIVQPKASKYVEKLEQLPGILKGMKEPPSKNQLCLKLQEVLNVSEYAGKKIIKSGVEQGIILEESTGDHQRSPKIYRLSAC